MRRLAALAALAGVSLFACMDTDPTMPGQQPATPSASILDGAHGGNAHFFFLPPLAPDPRADGVFNPALAPVVEICALADGGEACADPQPEGMPIRFTMEGSGPESVRLEEEDEHYAVNWQTRRHGLDEAVDYRIRVFPVEGGTELGHLDVDLVARGGRARRGGGRPTAGGDLLTARLGSTLPIRFRIEQGITCTETDDCIEVVVGTGGGTVVAPSAFGGVAIPQGALDAPVVIIVERVDVSTQPCLPGPLFQAEGCFRFDTDPSLSAVQASGLDEFNLDVVVGVCLDPDVLALPEHHQYALHKHDPDRPDLGIVQLPTAPVDYLDCSGFTALAAADGGPFMNLARAGWERVAPLVRWLGPSDLYAINLGFGGLTKSFSNIGWVRGLDFTVLAGDGQTGTAGSTLPVDPAVRVTATHWDPDVAAVPPPVQGVPVAFSFTDPAGNVTVALDTTDANGLASVPWTLGPAAGTNTLTVAGATIGPVTLSAQAVANGVIGRIAFVSSRDGSPDIHVMNADGSQRTNLTNNPATDWWPSWSPDATEIAFTSSRDGNAEIYVMNADGSGQTRLTNHPANESHTAWSPDGTRIAFTSDRDGNPEIYVMNADGSGQTRLTNHIAIDTEPSWSPDGTRIAFTSHRTGDSEIHVMNADGTALTNLTPNAPGLNDLPDWSPDGTKIVFHSSRSGSDVWVMNADGSQPTNLTNSPIGFARLNYFPAWSPDGTQIAFGSNRDDNHDIYVMNADGSGQTNLTNDAAVDSDPAWQPVPVDGGGDGSRIAYVAAIGDFATTQTSTVTAIDLDSETVTGSISVGSFLTDVAFSPDGVTAYVLNASTHDVSVIDVASGTVTGGIAAGSQPMSIALTPDGAMGLVANAQSDDVSVIDFGAGVVVTTIPVGNLPWGIAMTPDGSTAYVVNRSGNSVSIIDVATATVTGTIPAGLAPASVAFTPDGALAYVGTVGSEDVRVIDVATGTVTAVLPALGDVAAIAFTPDGAAAYIADSFSDRVHVIDVATGTVTDAIDVGFTPWDLALSPDGATCYVVNRQDDDVSVIDVASGTVTARIPVANDPRAIAIRP